MQMNVSQEDMKKAAALAALDFIKDDMIVGIGTGSTVNYFIDALVDFKQRIEGVVASSQASVKRLQKHGFSVFDLNTVSEISIYIDGADEINSDLQMIKGGGGALTGEKIIASMADKFICIADQNKKVEILGEFPIAIEVIPMARSLVAREIVKLEGNPVYREGFVSDYGNVILDVYNMQILEPMKLEGILNNIEGVVTNGIFSKRPADILLLGTEQKVLRF